VYATEADLVDRYGEDELVQLTDRLGTGAIDADVLARALADAAAEVDSYLRGRVSLPLASPPAELVWVQADIARYRLHGVRATEEARKRYEDARSWLRDVAAGRVLLDDDATPPTRIPSVAAPSAVFTDALLARMPG
jgi:phage gp36-like protein